MQMKELDWGLDSNTQSRVGFDSYSPNYIDTVEHEGERVSVESFQDAVFVRDYGKDQFGNPNYTPEFWSELSREFGLELNPNHELIQKQAEHFINTNRIKTDMDATSMATAIRKYSQDLFFEKQVPVSTILNYEGSLLTACAEKCEKNVAAMDIRVVEGRTWFNQYEAALVYKAANDNLALVAGQYDSVDFAPDIYSQYSENSCDAEECRHINHDNTTVDYTTAHTYIQPDSQAVQDELTTILGHDLSGLTEEQIVTLIHDYMLDNFSYIADEGENWASVDDTLASKTGDCEDLANTEASLLIAAFEKAGMTDAAANVSVVAGQMTAYGTTAGHAMVQYQDQSGNTWALDATNPSSLSGLDPNANSHLLFSNVQGQYGFQVYFSSTQSVTAIQVDKTDLIGFTTATAAFDSFIESQKTSLLSHLQANVGLEDAATLAQSILDHLAGTFEDSASGTSGDFGDYYQQVIQFRDDLAADIGAPPASSPESASSKTTIDEMIEWVFTNILNIGDVPLLGDIIDAIGDDGVDLDITQYGTQDSVKNWYSAFGFAEHVYRFDLEMKEMRENITTTAMNKYKGQTESGFVVYDYARVNRDYMKVMAAHQMIMAVMGAIFTASDTWNKIASELAQDSEVSSQIKNRKKVLKAINKANQRKLEEMSTFINQFIQTWEEHNNNVYTQYQNGIEENYNGLVHMLADIFLADETTIKKTRLLRVLAGEYYAVTARIREGFQKAKVDMPSGSALFNDLTAASDRSAFAPANYGKLMGKIEESIRNYERAAAFDAAQTPPTNTRVNYMIEVGATYSSYTDPISGDPVSYKATAEYANPFDYYFPWYATQNSGAAVNPAIVQVTYDQNNAATAHTNLTASVHGSAGTASTTYFSGDPTDLNADANDPVDQANYFGSIYHYYQPLRTPTSRDAESAGFNDNVESYYLTDTHKFFGDINEPRSSGGSLATVYEDGIQYDSSNFRNSPAWKFFAAQAEPFLDHFDHTKGQWGDAEAVRLSAFAGIELSGDYLDVNADHLTTETIWNELHSEGWIADGTESLNADDTLNSDPAPTPPLPSGTHMADVGGIIRQTAGTFSGRTIGQIDLDDDDEIDDFLPDLHLSLQGTPANNSPNVRALKRSIILRAKTFDNRLNRTYGQLDFDTNAAKPLIDLDDFKSGGQVMGIKAALGANLPEEQAAVSALQSQIQAARDAEFSASTTANTDEVLLDWSQLATATISHTDIGFDAAIARTYLKGQYSGPDNAQFDAYVDAMSDSDLYNTVGVTFADLHPLTNLEQSNVTLSAGDITTWLQGNLDGTLGSQLAADFDPIGFDATNSGRVSARSLNQIATSLASNPNSVIDARLPAISATIELNTFSDTVWNTDINESNQNQLQLVRNKVIANPAASLSTNEVLLLQEFYTSVAPAPQGNALPLGGATAMSANETTWFTANPVPASATPDPQNYGEDEVPPSTFDRGISERIPGDDRYQQDGAGDEVFYDNNDLDPTWTDGTKNRIRDIDSMEIEIPPVDDTDQAAGPGAIYRRDNSRELLNSYYGDRGTGQNGLPQFVHNASSDSEQGSRMMAIKLDTLAVAHKAMVARLNVVRVFFFIQSTRLKAIQGVTKQLDSLAVSSTQLMEMDSALFETRAGMENTRYSYILNQTHRLVSLNNEFQRHDIQVTKLGDTARRVARGISVWSGIAGAILMLIPGAHIAGCVATIISLAADITAAGIEMGLALNTDQKMANNLEDMLQSGGQTSLQNWQSIIDWKSDVDYSLAADLIEPDNAGVQAELETLIGGAVGTVDLSATYANEDALMQAVHGYMLDNYDYADDSAGDNWQNVTETIARDAGDCEDLSVLEASIAIRALQEYYIDSGVYDQVPPDATTTAALALDAARTKITLKAGAMFQDVENTGAKKGHVFLTYEGLSGSTYVMDPSDDRINGNASMYFYDNASIRPNDPLVEDVYEGYSFTGTLGFQEYFSAVDGQATQFAAGIEEGDLYGYTTELAGIGNTFKMARGRRNYELTENGYKYEFIQDDGPSHVKVTRLSDNAIEYVRDGVPAVDYGSTRTEVSVTNPFDDQVTANIPIPSSNRPGPAVSGTFNNESDGQAKAEDLMGIGQIKSALQWLPFIPSPSLSVSPNYGRAPSDPETATYDSDQNFVNGDQNNAFAGLTNSQFGSAPLIEVPEMNMILKAEFEEKQIMKDMFLLTKNLKSVGAGRAVIDWPKYQQLKHQLAKVHQRMRLAYTSIKTRIDFINTLSSNLGNTQKRQLSSTAGTVFESRFTLVTEQLGLLNGLFQSVQEANWNNAQVDGSRVQSIINFAVTTVFNIAGAIIAGIATIFPWVIVFLPIIQAVQVFLNATIQYFTPQTNSGYEMDLFRQWDDVSDKDDWLANLTQGLGGTNPSDNGGLIGNYDHDYTDEAFGTFRDGITNIDNPTGRDFGDGVIALDRTRGQAVEFMGVVVNEHGYLTQEGNASSVQFSEEEYLVYQGYRQDLLETGAQLWTFLALGRHQSKGRYFDTQYVDGFDIWIQRRTTRQFLLESLIYAVAQYLRSQASNIGNMNTSDNVAGNFAQDEINHVASHYLDQMNMVSTWQEYKNQGNDIRFFGDKAYDRAIMEAILTLIMGLAGAGRAKKKPGGLKKNPGSVGASMAYSSALSGLMYGILDGFVAQNKVGTSDSSTGQEEDEEAAEQTEAKRKAARKRAAQQKRRAITMAISGAIIGLVAARALRAGNSSVLRKFTIGLAATIFLTSAIALMDEATEKGDDAQKDENIRTSGKGDVGNALGFQHSFVNMGNLVKKKHKLRSFFAKLEAIAKVAQSQAEFTSSLAEELGYSTAGLAFAQGLSKARNLSKTVDEKILDNRYAMLRKFVARKNEKQKSRKQMFMSIIKLAIAAKINNVGKGPKKLGASKPGSAKQTGAKDASAGRQGMNVAKRIAMQNLFDIISVFVNAADAGMIQGQREGMRDQNNKNQEEFDQNSGPQETGGGANVNKGQGITQTEAAMMKSQLSRSASSSISDTLREIGERNRDIAQAFQTMFNRVAQKIQKAMKSNMSEGGEFMEKEAEKLADSALKGKAAQAIGDKETEIAAHKAMVSSFEKVQAAHGVASQAPTAAASEGAADASSAGGEANAGAAAAASAPAATPTGPAATSDPDAADSTGATSGPAAPETSTATSGPDAPATPAPTTDPSSDGGDADGGDSKAADSVDETGKTMSERLQATNQRAQTKMSDAASRVWSSPGSGIGGVLGKVVDAIMKLGKAVAVAGIYTAKGATALGIGVARRFSVAGREIKNGVQAAGNSNAWKGFKEWATVFKDNLKQAGRVIFTGDEGSPTAAQLRYHKASERNIKRVESDVSRISADSPVPKGKVADANSDTGTPADTVGAATTAAKASDVGPADADGTPDGTADATAVATASGNGSIPADETDNSMGNPPGTAPAKELTPAEKLKQELTTEMAEAQQQLRDALSGPLPDPENMTEDDRAELAERFGQVAEAKKRIAKVDATIHGHTQLGEDGKPIKTQKLKLDRKQYSKGEIAEMIFTFGLRQIARQMTRGRAEDEASRADGLAASAAFMGMMMDPEADMSKDTQDPNAELTAADKRRDRMLGVLSGRESQLSGTLTRLAIKYDDNGESWNLGALGKNIVGMMTSNDDRMQTSAAKVLGRMQGFDEATTALMLDGFSDEKGEVNSEDFLGFLKKLNAEASGDKMQNMLNNLDANRDGFIFKDSEGATATNFAQTALGDDNLRSEFLEIKREAFSKSSAMDEKKNRFFNSAGSDAFLGRLGFGEGRKQAHNFTRQLRKLDSEYESSIAKTESEAVANGRDPNSESDVIRMKRIDMAMDVYTQSGESLSEENRQQLRKMITGDGNRTDLVAQGFQNQFQNAEASLDGPRAGSDQISRLEGLRNDLGADAERSGEGNYEKFVEDLAKVDEAFEEKRIELDGHDSASIADTINEAADISAAGLFEDKDKKRREELEAELQNLAREISVKREGESQEVEEIAEGGISSDSGLGEDDADPGDAVDAARQSSTSSAQDLDDDALREATAQAGSAAAAAQIAKITDRALDTAPDTGDGPAPIDATGKPRPIDRERVADSLNNALLKLLDGGVSEGELTTISSGVKDTLNANATDRANSERDLMRAIKRNVSDPKRAQFARQLIRTTLRAVPTDMASQGVARMSVVDPRATYDEAGSKPGRVERSLSQALYQNVEKPTNAMAMELGFENVVQEVGGVAGDFAEQTATALKGADRDSDNAVDLSREGMMKRMAHSLPEELQGAVSDAAIDEAVAQDIENDKLRADAAASGTTVDPTEIAEGSLVDLAHVAGQYEVVGGFLMDLDENPSPDTLLATDDDKKAQVQAFASIMASPAQMQILGNVLSKLDDEKSARLIVKMVRMSEPSVLKAAGVDDDTASLVQEFGGPLDVLNFVPGAAKATGIMKSTIKEMESVTGFNKDGNPQALGQNLAGFLEDNPQFVPAAISEIRENGDFRVMAFAIEEASKGSELKHAMVMALPSDVRAQFEGVIAPTIREFADMSRTGNMPPEAEVAQLTVSMNMADATIKGAREFLEDGSKIDKDSPAYKELEKRINILEGLKDDVKITSQVIEQAIQDVMEAVDRVSPKASARIKGETHSQAVKELADRFIKSIKDASTTAEREANIEAITTQVNDARGLAFYSDELRGFARVVASAAMVAVKETGMSADSNMAELSRDASNTLAITGVRSFKAGQMNADHYLSNAIDGMRGIAENPPGTQSDVMGVVENLTNMLGKIDDTQATKAMRTQLLRIKYSKDAPAVKLGALQGLIAKNKTTLKELSDPKDSTFKERSAANIDRLEGHLISSMKNTLLSSKVSDGNKAKLLLSADKKTAAALLQELKVRDSKTYKKVLKTIQGLTKAKVSASRSGVSMQHYEWEKTSTGEFKSKLVKDRVQTNALEARDAFELIAEVAKDDTDLAGSDWFQGEQNFNKAAQFHLQSLSRQALSGDIDYSELKSQMANIPGFHQFLEQNIQFKGAFDAFNASSLGADPKDDKASLKRFLEALNSEAGKNFPSRTLLSGALVSAFVSHSELDLGKTDADNTKVAQTMQELVNGIHDPELRQKVLVESIRALSKADQEHLLSGLNSTTSSRNQDVLIAMMMVDPKLTAEKMEDFDSKVLDNYFKPTGIGTPSPVQQALVNLYNQQKFSKPDGVLQLIAQACRADSSILTPTLFGSDHKELRDVLKGASAQSIAILTEQMGSTNDPGLSEMLVAVSHAQPDAIALLLSQPDLEDGVRQTINSVIGQNLAHMGQLDEVVVKQVIDSAFNATNAKTIDEAGDDFIRLFADAISINASGALAFFNSETMDNAGEDARDQLLEAIGPSKAEHLMRPLSRNIDLLNDTLGKVSAELEVELILNLITKHTTFLIDEFDKLDSQIQDKVAQQFAMAMSDTTDETENELQDKVNDLQAQFDRMPRLDRLYQRSKLVAHNFQGESGNRELYEQNSELTLAQLRLAEMELKQFKEFGTFTGEAVTPQERMLSMNSDDRLRLLAVCCGVSKERLTRNANTPAQSERSFVSKAIGTNMVHHMADPEAMARSAALVKAAIHSPLFKGASKTALNELTKVNNNMLVLELAASSDVHGLTEQLKRLDEPQLTDLIINFDMREMTMSDESVRALKTLVEATTNAMTDISDTSRQWGQLRAIRSMAAQRGMAISMRLQQQDVANAHIDSLEEAPIPVEDRKSITETLSELSSSSETEKELKALDSRTKGVGDHKEFVGQARLLRNDDMLFFLENMVLSGESVLSVSEAIDPETELVDITRVSQIAVHESKVHAENMISFKIADSFSASETGVLFPLTPFSIPLSQKLIDKEKMNPGLKKHRLGLTSAEYVQMNRQSQSLMQHAKSVRSDAESFQHLGPADGKLFHMSDLNNRRGPAHNLPIMINNIRQRDVDLLEENMGEFTQFIAGIEDPDERELYLKAINDELDRQDAAETTLRPDQQSALSNSNDAGYLTTEKMRAMSAVHSLAVNIDRTLRANDPTYKGSALAEGLMHRTAVAVEKLIVGMAGEMAKTESQEGSSGEFDTELAIRLADIDARTRELSVMPRRAREQTPYAVLEERQFYGDMDPQDARALMTALSTDVSLDGGTLINEAGEVSESVDVRQLKAEHFDALAAMTVPEGPEGAPVRKYSDAQINTFKANVDTIKDAVADSQKNSFLPVLKTILETSSGEMQRRVQTAMRTGTKGTKYESVFLTVRDSLVFEAKAEAFASSMFSGSASLAVYQKGINEAVDRQNARFAQLVSEIPEDKQTRFIAQLSKAVEIQFRNELAQLKGQKNKLVIAKMEALNAMLDKMASRRSIAEEVPAETPAAEGDTELASGVSGAISRSESTTRYVVDTDFNKARNQLATTMANVLLKMPELPQSANDLRRMGAIMAKASFSDDSGAPDRAKQKEAFTTLRKKLNDRNFGDMAMHARGENADLGQMLDEVQQENLRRDVLVYDEAVEESVKYILTGMSQGRDEALAKPSDWRGKTNTGAMRRKRMVEIMKNPHINDAQKMIVMERLMHTDMVLFAQALEDTGDQAFKWLSYFTSDGNRMRTFVEKFLTAGMSGTSFAAHLGASFVNRFNPVKSWRDGLERGADHSGDGVQAIIRRKMVEMANLPREKRDRINASLKSTFEAKQINRTDMNIDIFPAQFIAMMHRHFNQSNEVAIMVKSMGGVGTIMDNTDLINDPLLADFWREYLLTEYSKGGEVSQDYWDKARNETDPAKKGRYARLERYMDRFQDERGLHTKKNLNFSNRRAAELLMVIDARWDEIPEDMALENTTTQDGPGLFEQLKARPLSGVKGFENLDRMGKTMDRLTESDRVKAKELTGELQTLVDRSETPGAHDKERSDELKTELEALLKRAGIEDEGKTPARDEGKIKEKRKHNLEFVRSILTTPSPNEHMDNEDRLAVRADVIKYIVSERKDLYVALMQHIDEDPKLRPEQKQAEKHKLLLMTSEMMDYSGGARSVEGAKLKAELMQYVTHLPAEVMSKKEKAFINARLFTNTMREEGMNTQVKRSRKWWGSASSFVLNGIARGMAFIVTAGTSEIIPRYIGHGSHIKLEDIWAGLDDFGRRRDYVGETQRFDEFRFGFDPYIDDKGQTRVDDIDLMVDTFLEMEKVVGGEAMDELAAAHGRQLTESMIKGISEQLKPGSALRAFFGEAEDISEMTIAEMNEVDRKVHAWAENGLVGLAKLQARWYESVDSKEAKADVLETVARVNKDLVTQVTDLIPALEAEVDSGGGETPKLVGDMPQPTAPDFYGKTFITSVANYQGVQVATSLGETESRTIFGTDDIDETELDELIRTGQTLQAGKGHEAYRDSESKSLVRELRDIHSQFAGTKFDEEKPFQIDDFFHFLETINKQMEALEDQILRRPIGISGYSPPGYSA